MPSTSPSNLTGAPTPADAHSVVRQVTNHIQMAFPSISSTTAHCMATAFEQSLKGRATSRQDYVQRAYIGVQSILESLKNLSFPKSRTDANSVDGAVSTPKNQALTTGHEEADVEPSIEELVSLAVAAVSNGQINTPTAISIAPKNISVPETQAQTPNNVQSNTTEPVNERNLVTKEEVQVQGTKSEKKDQEALSKTPPGKKPPVRSTRRTSRTQTARPSTRKTTSTPSSQAPTPPTTRSRARRAAKRTPRKRSTRGRKRDVKQAENTSPSTLENEKEKPQSPDVRTDLKDGQNPGASESLASTAAATNEDGMNHMATDVYMTAQEHLNQGTKTDLRRSQQMSPSLESGRHPSANAGLRTSVGNVPAPHVNNPPVAVTDDHATQAAGSGQRESVRQIPTETPKPSASNLGRIGTYQSAQSSINDQQTAPGDLEYVRLCSNGNVEIEDGISVTQEEILVAAAEIGIILTAAQLPSLRRAHALSILVKSSQLKILTAHNITPMVTQQTQVGQKQPSVRPQMTGPLHTLSLVREKPQPQPQPHIARPSTQAPNQTGMPLNFPQHGPFSHMETPTSMPNGTSVQQPTPICQAATQRTHQPSRFATNVAEVQVRLRKFQMDYRQYYSLLQVYLSGMKAPPSDNLVRYLRCCVSLLAMDSMQVRGVSVEVIDSVEKFLRNYLNHRLASAKANLGQQVPQSEGNENIREPITGLQTSASDYGNLGRQDHTGSMPHAAVNPVPIPSGPPVSNSVANGISTGIRVDATRRTTALQPEEVAEQLVAHESDSRIGSIFPAHNNSCKAEVPVQSELHGRKRKSPPTPETEKNGKRMATPNTEVKVSAADIIHITDGKNPLPGVAVYCQLDKNGNMFNALRMSDSPDLEEVLGRICFMLNCAMKLTKCYISVSEGKKEGKTRHLEGVVVSLEPRSINCDPSKDEDQLGRTGLSMTELINVECSEARKRYGSLTVQMIEEFGRPVFHCILRRKDHSFPKLELHIAGCRKGESKDYGYERPPMGWVGVLEEVRNLFYSSLKGGKGLEAMIRSWILAKDKTNGWMELRERSKDDVHAA